MTSHFNDFLARTCPMTSCIYYEVILVHPAPLAPIVTSLVGILWSPDGGVSLLWLYWYYFTFAVSTLHYRLDCFVKSCGFFSGYSHRKYDRGGVRKVGLRVSHPLLFGNICAINFKEKKRDVAVRLMFVFSD